MVYCAIIDYRGQKVVPSVTYGATGLGLLITNTKINKIDFEITSYQYTDL